MANPYGPQILNAYREYVDYEPSSWYGRLYRVNIHIIKQNQIKSNHIKITNIILFLRPKRLFNFLINIFP